MLSDRCLIYNLNYFLQVSVLTDQVEVQGEKIRDLDMCLEEHREKLNSTEEMLQQVCWSLICKPVNDRSKRQILK